MTIKKAYQEIVSLLEANEDKKVKSILDEVRALASAKTSRAGGASTALRNTDGDVVAILCYYFKRWMPLVGDAAVEFGAKKNTPTGLNSMCKEGSSHFSRQLRESKQANAELLTRVANGEVAPSDIVTEQENIEAARKQIVETDLGFETKEEVVAYLAEAGVALPETA